MNRLKTFLPALAGIAILAGLAMLVGLVVYAFFQYLSSVPKELGAALVAAAATILVATVTVMVGRYYERRKELEALFREKKTDIYDEFLKEFFTLFWGASKTDAAAEKDLVSFLREFTRKLVLWSGPEVIKAFVAWKNHLAKGTPDAKSIFLTEAFLLAIRRDLRHSNIGLRKGFFARLFLQQGELFLDMAAKNPDLTLAALAEVENALNIQKVEAEGG